MVKLTPESTKNHALTSILPSFASGAVAGAFAKTAIAPLDRTKIHFQISNTNNYSLKGAINFIKLTYQETGFLSLFRGNSATMARVIPYSAIQFSAHEEYKTLLQVDKNGNKTPFKRFITGSMAAATATIIVYPLDRARAVLAVSSKSEYKNLAEVLTKTYNQNGFKALYRGCYPSLLGIIPYAGSSWFTFETLKLIYEEKTAEKINPFYRFIFGGVAGAAGQGLTYPLDIVRRRMQTGRISSDQKIYLSLYQIWKSEGIKNGLYKGLSMNWIKGPISAGISFSTYDYIFAFLKTFS